MCWVWPHVFTILLKFVAKKTMSHPSEFRILHAEEKKVILR